MRSINSGSTLGGWPPTCNSARTKEVNSWPKGIPAKRTSISLPTGFKANEGVRSVLLKSSLKMS